MSKQLHISETIPAYGYQDRVANFLCGEINTLVKLSENVQAYIASKGRGILYIAPGLGKTRISIKIHQKLCWDKRALIVCKKNAVNTWRREYTKWVPGITDEDITLVVGQKHQRKKLWKQKTKITVTTWDMLHNDYSMVDLASYGIMFGDESQKLRNYKTVLFKAYRQYAKEIKYFVLLSGSLMRKGPQDLWTSLNLCDPRKFSSYWIFFKTYCETIEGFFGMEYIGPKNTKSLAMTIAPYLIRLRESDDEVEAQRPPKTRDYLPVQMSNEQLKVYKSFVDHGAARTSEDKLIIAPNEMAQIMKLRQLLVCPKILDPTMGYGTAIEHMVSTLEDDPHQVIFTPFRLAVSHITEAILAGGYPPPFILQGGTSPAELRNVEELFNHERHGIDHSCIVTIKFAESFELPSAKQGKFIGWEWTVDENIQAEDRLHRLNTPHPINILYYKYDNTIEGSMLQYALDTKANNITLSFKDYVNTLRGGIWNMEIENKNDN